MRLLNGNAYVLWYKRLNLLKIIIKM